MIDRELRARLLDAYLLAIPLIVLNLVWFLACLPLVTAFPSTAGLFYATNKLAHGQSAGWRDLFDGFRRYLVVSYPWGLLNLLVAAIVFSNVVYYSQQDAGLTQVARVVLVALGLFWAMLQVYTFPFILEQERPSLRLALRNSLVIVLKRPLHTLALTFALLALAVITTVALAPAWLFITASLCAYTANAGTLAAIGKLNPRKAGSAETQAEDDMGDVQAL